jgi:hypothetical protein
VAAEQEHDVAAANVAHKMRVPIWEVHANVGDAPRRAVPVPGGDDVTPDIVAFEKHTGRLAAIAAVETASTLSAGASEWKLFQLLAPKFFLYVPEECLEEATRLCRRHGIPLASLRVYYYNSRNQFITERGWRAQKRKAAS